MAGEKKPQTEKFEDLTAEPKINKEEEEKGKEETNSETKVEETPTGWGEPESPTSSKPVETTTVLETPVTNKTTTDGWGAPEEKSTTDGWGAPEETTTTTTTTTGGWGAPEEITKSEVKVETKSETGGWGAPEETTTTTTTGGWGAPEETTTTTTGGWGAPETSRNDSYNPPAPRQDDSYKRRNDSYGQYQQDNRPPRQYDSERRYGSNDRGRQFQGRSEGFESRKRYEPSVGYSREDKRPRYDNRRDDNRREDWRDERRDDSRRDDSRRDDQYYSRQRDDRYSRPPYDDYERGRDYNRNSSYESRGENEKPYEPRVTRPRKPFPTDVSPSKAIGIFGLSIHATENDLREFLSEELVDISDYKITVVHDRNTGLSKGYGFVYFQCLEDSIKAKEKLFGKSIKGKEIRVDYSISDALRPSYR